MSTTLCSLPKGRGWFLLDVNPHEPIWHGSADLSLQVWNFQVGSAPTTALHTGCTPGTNLFWKSGLRYYSGRCRVLSALGTIPKFPKWMLTWALQKVEFLFHRRFQYLDCFHPKTGPKKKSKHWLFTKWESSEDFRFDLLNQTILMLFWSKRVISKCYRCQNVNLAVKYFGLQCWFELTLEVGWFLNFPTGKLLSKSTFSWEEKIDFDKAPISLGKSVWSKKSTGSRSELSLKMWGPIVSTEHLKIWL